MFEQIIRLDQHLKVRLTKDAEKPIFGKFRDVQWEKICNFSRSTDMKEQYEKSMDIMGQSLNENSQLSDFFKNQWTDKDKDLPTKLNEMWTSAKPTVGKHG